MKRWIQSLFCLVLGVALIGCASPPPEAEPGRPKELVVSAAASLSSALQDAAGAFAQSNGGVTIRFNFGSSGALQHQIEQGAPVDLFIAAGAAPVDALVAAGMVEEGSVRPVVSNRLVLVRPKQEEVPVGWEDLARVRRLALGNPQHVPAGQYGKAVLEYLDLWATLEPRLILGEDVRQVLQYVESGEVDGGLVYRSDAVGSDRVSVVAEAPAGSHPPILYPMAVLLEAPHPAEAERFAEFLRSPRGQEIMTRYGFGGV